LAIVITPHNPRASQVDPNAIPSRASKVDPNAISLPHHHLCRNPSLGLAKVWAESQPRKSHFMPPGV